MDVITGILYGVGIVVTGAVSLALIELKKVSVRSGAKGVPVASKNGSKTQISDYLNQLPEALNQAVTIYNEQLQICVKKGMTEEQAKPILKPLKDRIDLLESIKKYEFIARPAAAIADKGVNTIMKALDGI